VIVILVAIIVVIALVMVVPAIATAVARNVVNHLDRSPASGSIDQSIVEARLGRIEEAIDAMATQIEKLTDQQRALLARQKIDE
jgi:predicted PurR-regulated permease PerM